MKKIFNIFGFQLCWWACVLGVKYENPYIGPALMSIFIFIHFRYCVIEKKEYSFIIVSTLLGTLVDSIFLNTTLIEYNGLTFNFIAPFWIIAMWAGFSATVNHSLDWLKNNYLFCFLLGAISGPLSYVAGLKFNAISFDLSITVVSILAISWGIIVPGIFFINNIFSEKK